MGGFRLMLRSRTGKTTRLQKKEVTQMLLSIVLVFDLVSASKGVAWALRSRRKAGAQSTEILVSCIGFTIILKYFYIYKLIMGSLFKPRKYLNVIVTFHLVYATLYIWTKTWIRRGKKIRKSLKLSKNTARFQKTTI